MSFSVTDRKMMSEALKLAAQGRLTTSPNPTVGCVIVADGKVVGQGFTCLLYTSPSPRDLSTSRMPSSA